jgi:ribosomal protein L20A (L18A)
VLFSALLLVTTPRTLLLLLVGHFQTSYFHLLATTPNPQMVKEFRALSRAEAVESMYQDMAARHRARFRNVQILRVAEIEKKDDVRRPYIKQLLEPGLKFPLPHRRTKSKAWYAANRPSTWA